MPDEIRIMLADDEALVRDGLREYLAGEPDVRIVAEARDGLEALSLIESARPDLLFLDVQMPELDGFEVLAQVAADARPVVVFVTAFESYALRAFEAHAVDYLLKPFDRSRFGVAMERARAWLARLGERRVDLVLQRLLDDVARQRRLTRFCVKHAGKLRLVPLQQVDWIEARGNYVHLHTPDGEHLLRQSLADLEQRLDPTEFVRIHRSALVRVSAIQDLERRPGGDYRLRLASGGQLTVSRTHWLGLAQVLGLK